MKINCLIIDDEPSSLNVLKNYIQHLDFLNLIDEFSNAIDAMEFLSRNNSIDLIFLDINMPKISGLSFYQSLQNPPAVIFTTAYSEHAVEAFNVSAIDYLLKPFSFDRFLTAVNKFKQTRTEQKPSIDDSPIFIKSDKKLYKLAPKSIYYIEAFGDYVKVHLEDRFLLTYNTFKNVLNDLPSTFIKIHKSYAINIEKATSIEGNRVVVNDQLLPIGETFKSSFLERFKKA